MKEFTGLDFNAIYDAPTARNLAASSGVEVEINASWGECLSACFETHVEHKLINPTHVTDLPADISPLAKQKGDDKRYAQRFETYINGYEIANAFSEMNDPIVQREIMSEQVKLAHLRGERENTLDEDFLRALEHGMPPAGGLGIGIDRLCMLLTNAMSIRDVILFPTRRPLND